MPHHWGIMLAPVCVAFGPVPSAALSVCLQTTSKSGTVSHTRDTLPLPHTVRGLSYSASATRRRANRPSTMDIARPGDQHTQARGAFRQSLPIKFGAGFATASCLRGWGSGISINSVWNKNSLTPTAETR
jgi:hypothetical protein